MENTPVSKIHNRSPTIPANQYVRVCLCLTCKNKSTVTITGEICNVAQVEDTLSFTDKYGYSFVFTDIEEITFLSNIKDVEVSQEGVNIDIVWT